MRNIETRRAHEESEFAATRLAYDIRCMRLNSSLATDLENYRYRKMNRRTDVTSVLRASKGTLQHPFFT